MPLNIIVRGARHHNLKNIDLDIPTHRLVVVTGLSGSGKSTLAFDTLYAEGQRRYVESLSTYARQFLERLEKPDVDLVEGLSPAISIEQKSTGHNPRSTVGTVTEINDYLRLLYARVGTTFCYKCHRPIQKQSIDQIIDWVMALAPGTRIQILSPILKDEKGDHGQRILKLQRDGFSRIRVDGRTQEIESMSGLDARHRHSIDVVVDRLVIKPAILNRLSDSLELAMGLSGGRVTVSAEGMDDYHFNEEAVCPECGIRYPELSPTSFSFNSPNGACPQCDGLGTIRELDPDLVVPNPNLSLREGAIAPWAERKNVHFTEIMDALTQAFGVDIWTPFRDLPDPVRETLLHGSGNESIPLPGGQGGGSRLVKKRFEGVMPWLERRYKASDHKADREEIEQFMNTSVCGACAGSRLNPIARSVRIGQRTLAEVSALSIRDARAFFQSLTLDEKNARIARLVLKEIIERLSFLESVGLHYLTLGRSAQTLSGGESQRIRLATQVGSKLTGVLYVLDEPSIGLHQRDHKRLLDTLIQLRDMGNTVLVVEHDEETILSADHVVDMGPGAGVNGGRVVFSGTPGALLSVEESITAEYLSGRKRIEVPVKRLPGNGDCLEIVGASAHNLKHIDVRFPLGCLVCVTGVSGSGKSSLVLETLYRAISQRLYRARIPAGAHDAIRGLEHIDKVIHIDQSPIGRTPRSNPGTYTGIFSNIRDLFSRTPEARARGYKSGRFSFNIKGGRCEACMGDGIVKIEMHFLPDIYVPCNVCHGKRYNRETLEIRYKGKNIDQVLNMTVSQGLSFFDRIGVIRTQLNTLADVGLGYIRIGQPATTLSGGEAQRIKLARELSKRETGKTLYIMDEPTTGLHMDDIDKLLHVIFRLVRAGNTVIVIEHNLEVIKTADWVIDLGPEGGDQGGELIVCGTPEQVAGHTTSHTGRYLKKKLYKDR